MRSALSMKRPRNPTAGMRKFDNPEYIDDDEGYKFDEFGFIGFDAWQVNGGTIFDDIIITDNKAEADDFAKKWKALTMHKALSLQIFKKKVWKFSCLRRSAHRV